MSNIDTRWFLLPAVLLVVALAPLPYGYYTLLRLVVCIAAIIVALVAYQRQKAVNWQVVTFGIVAILFNPIIIVALNRGVWAALDIACAALFLWVSGIIGRRAQP